MSITRNRELSQFGSFLYIDDASQSIGITTNSSNFIGIGTILPTSKLTVQGDVKISGVVTASNFYGDLIGTSSFASGVSSTANINTSGIVTASYFYINGTPLVDAALQTWDTIGVGGTTYILSGNVGIGTSVTSEKLQVSGNVLATGNITSYGSVVVSSDVTASRFISTITTGTSPFLVQSSTLVTNLNADFIRGKIVPSGDIVGTTDIQTLTNKTLTTPTIGSGGANFSGSSSGSTNLRASSTASGTLTLPAETGTLVSTASNGVVTSAMISDGTITNSDISNSAAISISKLSASTISGVSLGGNLGTLTIGSYLNGSSYNGSSAVTISANASVLNVGSTLVARDTSGNFTAGTISATYFSGSGALLTGIPNSATTATSANTASAIVARDASGNFTAGTITATDFNSTSDINLKENIEPFLNAVDTLKQLDGVHFNWKSNSKKSIGVIAQEIEKILPELVSENEGIKNVNYSGLIGVLIQAVKELEEKIEILKSK